MLKKGIVMKCLYSLFIIIMIVPVTMQASLTQELTKLRQSLQELSVVFKQPPSKTHTTTTPDQPAKKTKGELEVSIKGLIAKYNDKSIFAIEFEQLKKELIGYFDEILKPVTGVTESGATWEDVDADKEIVAFLGKILPDEIDDIKEDIGWGEYSFGDAKAKIKDGINKLTKP